MAKVRISGELFRELCTKGWEPGGRVECIEGVPEGATWGTVSIVPNHFSGGGYIVELEVEHPDIEDEIVDVVHKVTYYEPHNAYKVRNKTTGKFFSMKKHFDFDEVGDVYDYITGLTILNSFSEEDNVELVEYKLVEVKYD